MKSVIDFAKLQIKLASPEDILSWSHGEVLRPETINYRTLKPEKGGLFCERIFGPSKDWECYCGKYKRIRYRGIICDKCGVEVTRSIVRRERMGHIKLAYPVAHVWFFKGVPSKLALLLDISPRDMSSVIYFAKYLVLSVDKDERDAVMKRLDKDLKEKHARLSEEYEAKIKEATKKAKAKQEKLKTKIKIREQRELALEEIKLKNKIEIRDLREQLAKEKRRAEEVYTMFATMIKKVKRFSVLDEDIYLRLDEYGYATFLKVKMGAEAVLDALGLQDFEKLADTLRKKIKTLKGAKQVRATKRLRTIEGLLSAKIDPRWMILRVLPVIPPDLRPMVQLSGGRFATSDLNDLYRRVINRNSRLKYLIELGAPEIILRNEKRMLQEAVDALIDSTKVRSRRTMRRELRSLSDMLRGKQGRFRQNLLGKRVDYSGRSVIVVGPELKLNQCGLPKDMAVEMFKPFVLRELIVRGFAPNVKSAKYFLERRSPEVFDILEKVTANHVILLNRAPTLHKLGIQAFYPVLVEGKAIRLHPCVCAGFNADFDGDQMAVHIPLSERAKREAEQFMLPKHNLLKPANGSPVVVPNKEMALGCYWLTMMDETDKRGEGRLFSSKEELMLALDKKIVGWQTRVKVRVNGKLMETTAGRCVFNEVLPKAIGFVNESVTANKVKEILNEVISRCSRQEAVEFIDKLKDLGFEAATRSGLSVGVFDCQVIDSKEAIITQANKLVEQIQDNYAHGMITNEERVRLSNKIWIDTTAKIANLSWESFSEDNPVKVIIDSGGTRASKDQVKQLVAMRGLVVDPLGNIVEMPTKSNFREGLTIFEYVTSARGSRKGLTDSALKTADAGYLTRRLVDVVHEVVIREKDCGTQDYLEIRNDNKRKASFAARVVGRFLGEAVRDPKTKKVLYKKGYLLKPDDVANIVKKGIDRVLVRSPLGCKTRNGLCVKCYGIDFSNKEVVNIGVPVGVIAAQSIGEPGTQLTMRVKHAGGIVGLDVTQGLPRVEELFEARLPKVLSPIAEISGKVEVVETSEGYKVRVKSQTEPVEEREYLVPLTSILKYKTGDLVAAGDQLASGGLDLRQVLAVRGLREAQKYLIDEIQAVYESQGIPINDKHFEVVVRKMCDKLVVESVGDTSLVIGDLISRSRFERENRSVLAQGGEPATARVVILGLIRSALCTDSWLSAASFQTTTNILANAASLGQVDPLLGLKENVIIGRLIPTSPERAMIKD